jgi:hypothetical protein
MWANTVNVPPGAALEWDGGGLGAECERADVVRQSVETYLGRAVFGPGGDLVVQVHLKRLEKPGGSTQIVAEVSQRDASGKQWGQRSVSADDCASLDDALALVVALLVDSPPAPTDSQSEPAPAPPPPSAQPSGPEPAGADAEIQTAPGLAKALEPPGHWALFGFGGVALGLLPDTGFGGGGALFLKPRHFWGFVVQADAMSSQRRALASGAMDAALLLGRAGLCPLQGANEGAFWSACATIGLGRFSVESYELFGAGRHHEWLWAPGGSVMAAWRLERRWLLGGGMAITLPQWRKHYKYRDLQGESHEAFTGSRIGLGASLGVGMLFD